MWAVDIFGDTNIGNRPWQPDKKIRVLSLFGDKDVKTTPAPKERPALKAGVRIRGYSVFWDISVTDEPQRADQSQGDQAGH